MAIKKPDFITKQLRRGRVVASRPYKWGPGVPSLAIQFDEIPGESAPKQEGEILENVLGTQDLIAIVTQNDFMIEVLLP
jgi:hypothetical protein